jgi:hypothetical protein
MSLERVVVVPKRTKNSKLKTQDSRLKVSLALRDADFAVFTATSGRAADKLLVCPLLAKGVAILLSFATDKAVHLSCGLEWTADVFGV